jgi:protoheme IX farnesyltransferase
MSIYWRLIRPGLLLTVLFSMTIAALTTPQPPSWTCLIHALLGTALLIVGATVMNQLVEHRSDAAMERTASRPLPTGQWTPRQAMMIAVFASLAGIGYLAALEPPVVAILAALSWGIYVLIYTPLKRASVWHIPLGALAGALPVLLGTATANAVFSPVSLTLFGVVFFWQFPHTAAIGWIYREQYAAVVDPSGRLTGRFALVGAAGLLVASLVPATLSMVGWLYVVVALSLGLAHLAIAAKFFGKPSDANARLLWRISLVHLPLLLVLLLVSCTHFAPCYTQGI